MEIGMFLNDLQKIRLEDEAKTRIVQAILNPKQIGLTLHRKKRVLKPALIASLLVFLVVGSALLLLLPDWLDQFSRAGCPPGFFTDRYYSLIEINGSAFIHQGNGTLYRLDAVNPLHKIGRLNARQLLSDGSSFFYVRSSQIYQAAPDLTGRTRVLREQQPIELDYVTSDNILYHFGNHDNYTLYDRQSGETRQLFHASEEKNYSFLAGSGNMAVFVHGGQDYTEKLYAVNLTDSRKTEIFDGSIRSRAVIVDEVVYFTPVDESTNRLARELWSVRLDGNNLIKHDLSSIHFKSIQAIAGSGQDLLIATNENIARHQGKIYLYRPGTGLFTLLQDEIGLIDRLFATDQYYCYYDLGIGDTAGQAFAGLIGRRTDP